MFKIYFIIFLLFTGFIIPVLAQDTLYLNNGVRKIVKVEEIGPTVIRYKKYGELNGPTFTVGTNTIEKIAFENGTIELISEYSNKPQEDNSKNGVNDSLEAKYRKNRNYLSSNFIDYIFMNANLHYDYLFKNNIIGLHFNVLYGINSHERAKRSILNPWKKHIITGLGLKFFLSPKKYRDQFYVNPLLEAGYLTLYSKEVINQKMIDKFSNEPIFVLSLNFGNITNLTPNFFIDFNGGIGIRRQYTYPVLALDEAQRWTTFPTVKLGFKIGLRI